MHKEIPVCIRDYVNNECHVGSREICNPPPTDTDDDYLCLVSNLDIVRGLLSEDGWALGGSMHLTKSETSRWSSYRKGELNLVVTDNPTYFYDFELAVKVCKKLNVMNKLDRITIHEAIIYNQFTE